LLKNGYSVRCLDRFFFGDDVISHFSSDENVEIVKGDIRTADRSIMKGVDAVVDMASLSNDPSGELNPDLTLSINYKGRARLAKIAKESGVSRYILMSSCSVYGFRDDVADEEASRTP